MYQLYFSPKDREIFFFVYGIICALLFGFELHIARRTLIFKFVKNNVQVIDGDIYDPNIEGLVFFQSNITRYNLVRDKIFKISEYCGELTRNVQYCQWHEIAHAHTVRRNNQTYTYYTYTYHKGWSHSQINSLLFHNPLYHNPSIESIPEISYRSPAKAGAYTIDNNIELHGKYEILYPNIKQLKQFDKSYISNSFEYTGRGIFYVNMNVVYFLNL